MQDSVLGLICGTIPKFYGWIKLFTEYIELSSRRKGHSQVLPNSGALELSYMVWHQTLRGCDITVNVGTVAWCLHNLVFNMATSGARLCESSHGHESSVDDSRGF